MRNSIFVLVFILIITMLKCAPTSKLIIGTQSEHSITKEIKKKVQIQFLLYLPDDYENVKTEWPMILFLHGAGERGDSLSKVKLHGPPKLIEKGQKFPFIIVSPQCPENQWWSIEALDVLFKYITDNYRVDKNRIYLTGLSMGGFGTWSFAIQYPTRFAAIAPICGGGDTTKVKILKDLPTWVFHGAKDEIVPIQRSQEMVDALKKVNGNVKFTIYPEANHDSWTETYNNPELYEWFLKHRRDHLKK